MKNKIVIGITDCSKYPNYEKWILGLPGVETIRLSYAANNFSDINKCDAVLLTGGEDVAPSFYRKPEYLKFCDADNMDERRDEFELKILAHTQQQKMPVLGICRGLQIANVFFKGTLIPDIPEFKQAEHSKFGEGKDRYHAVRVNPFSLLKQVSGIIEGEVNSAHHQAVDQPGDGLISNAYSADGIIEGLEWAHPDEKPFLLLVQWHPERIIDQNNPLAERIRNYFVEFVKQNA